jgi:hypothetical protein
MNFEKCPFNDILNIYSKNIELISKLGFSPSKELLSIILQFINNDNNKINFVCKIFKYYDYLKITTNEIFYFYYENEEMLKFLKYAPKLKYLKMFHTFGNSIILETILKIVTRRNIVKSKIVEEMFKNKQINQISKNTFYSFFNNPFLNSLIKKTPYSYFQTKIYNFGNIDLIVKLLKHGYQDYEIEELLFYFTILPNLKKYIKHKPSINCLLTINNNYRIVDKLFKCNYKINMISKELINIYSKNNELQIFMKYTISLDFLIKIIQLDNFELILILLKNKYTENDICKYLFQDYSNIQHYFNF